MFHLRYHHLRSIAKLPTVWSSLVSTRKHKSTEPRSQTFCEKNILQVMWQSKGQWLWWFVILCVLWSISTNEIQMIFLWPRLPTQVFREAQSFYTTDVSCWSVPEVKPHPETESSLGNLGGFNVEIQTKTSHYQATTTFCSINHKNLALDKVAWAKCIIKITWLCSLLDMLDKK